MMACLLVPLVLSALLTEASGWEQSSSCPPRWLLVGQRCFGFYPVWSSWSTAESMCSQTAGHLASLHTQEERQCVQQLVSRHTPVWLGGSQTHQNGRWLWTDESPFGAGGWTNQSGEGGACMQMDPESGELHGAPCGELRFYVCSTNSTVSPQGRSPVQPDLVPGVSLFDVLWSHGDPLAEEILHSSSFLKELHSGHLTQRCYTSFIQQEALYLQRVGSMLQVLVSRLQEADDTRPLLLDALKLYSSRNQSLPASPPPQWLLFSLQSFHRLVTEEPVYWLVALSARACLRNFLFEEQLLSERAAGDGLVTADSLYQEWREESLKEVAWTHRYRTLMEDKQDQMIVFEAINIFREHMMHQKSFYKAVSCDEEGGL